MNEMSKREQDAAVIKAYDGAVHESARPYWTFEQGMEYANARVNRHNIYKCAVAIRRELDRLTDERDAARAAHAELIARLTKLADDNIRYYEEHVSLGDDMDDVSAAAWGAAGRELREAIAPESEAPE